MSPRPVSRLSVRFDLVQYALTVDDFDRDLGTWMALQREKRSISQDAVATQMSLDQPALSKIERGRRRVGTYELLHWAESVGVTDAELHGELETLRRKHFSEYRRAIREP